MARDKPYPGASRREVNHAKNEEKLLKLKAKEAQRQAIEKQKAERRAQQLRVFSKRQRNNFREY